MIEYIVNNQSLSAIKITNLLNQTINGLVDEDNIFYQIITINYIHYMILSTVILTGKVGVYIENTQTLQDKLENTIDIDNVDKNIVVDLIKKINKDNVKLYDFVNSIFSYIYQYVNEFSSKTAPLAVVNESLKIFKSQKQKGVVVKKFVKIK